MSWETTFVKPYAGYTRDVPLNPDGTVNWHAAPAWNCCLFNNNPPYAQGVYIVGDHYRQNVWWSASDCREYHRAIDNQGNLTGRQTYQNCGTNLSSGSSGLIETYRAYVSGQMVRESIWRGGRGYLRQVPLKADLSDVDWAAKPAWRHCCTRTSPPKSQGSYLLSY